jgi:hypothetical protein
MGSFSRFKSTFDCTDDRSCGDLTLIEKSIPPSVLNVISELGGQSFNSGIYRVLKAEEIAKATKAALLGFPELAGRIVVFGYDWLGRQFAADSNRLSDGAPEVLMLEVSVGEAMQIPVDAIAFHENELVDYSDDALAQPFFQLWQASTHSMLMYDQCVGYRVPLFLGGPDTLDNLEVYDLSVYWHICGQLLTKAVTLKKGQTIADITISK